ncbi:Mitochondrial intermembrane space import and assembly protein 40 [Taphrina deformans PYCC 5710]|uniref:Mitochondrial intermembrane space import and assembly protein 40 n=1 Tax=Taphrina deformans (strain PYCC 5710 / ATCC 11124 / CBS 356.35 / IMI 108563 / JCM 9778 / NBRC 8474) TaxID=1097556 RepID=R4X8F9_TAPDE|nr:Mitochondrial intermembrane space import and assembly protein 40 [Taphrina deformans PYCC 5710]|eukprot:CCG81576.1 Mitochondrial intermembrane space import and assembly protein 40 [Taphrina deformans PYCC 5710]
MFTRFASRSLSRQALAISVGAASYATYSLARPVHLDGTFDKVKEAASDIGEKISSKSPLKPQSPAGVPGAKTSHNPSTSMNHGQTAGESDDKQADPLVSAQKKKQKASGNSTNNDDKAQTAKKGGGTGAKISSGHEIDEDGQRVPNHDGIKASSQPKKSSKSSSQDSPLNGAAASGMEEKVGEAKKEEAFNEETGEINWDCPCLGGMAHGPCGEDFKSAFSCFIYSKEEPKGSECLDAFKKMQGCFKEHEDIYGNLVDDSETPEGKVIA